MPFVGKCRFTAQKSNESLVGIAYFIAKTTWGLNQEIDSIAGGELNMQL